jgi:heterodisulfide reductase subunit D
MLMEKFKLPKQANVVFFIGCVSSSLLIKIMNSAIKVLRKSDVSYTVLEDEWCCGNILGTTGQGKSETFRTHAEHNLNAVKATGANTLITACPGCYRTFTEMYPKYVDRPDFQVLHFTEYMADLIDSDKISFKKSLDKTIAYHDPCELGRLSGIFEPPRKILETIPGLTLVELNDNKSNCNCCGNGGGINSLEPDLAMNLSLKKIDEVLDTTAELLVSSCPNCRNGLGNAIVEKKQRLAGNGGGELNLEMKDITELVSKLV